jgi:hypothetical protein
MINKPKSSYNRLVFIFIKSIEMFQYSLPNEYWIKTQKEDCWVYTLQQLK